MFDLATVRDFYQMVLDDFDDFMDEPHSARRALHCAISAYHVYDWVWADWVKHDETLRAKQGIGRNKDQFRIWLGQRCVWFAILEDVVNCTKHHGRPPMVDGFKVEAAPPTGEAMELDEEVGGWDGPVRYVASNYPVGPKGKGYLVFDFGAEEASELANSWSEADLLRDEQNLGPSQRYMPAAHVLEVVVRMWRDFFRAYRPDLVMPVSAHHVD